MSKKFVLVFNCGSSSLKFSIIDIIDYKKHVSGIAEYLSLPKAKIRWKINNNVQEKKLTNGSTHKDAIYFIINVILMDKSEYYEKIFAIGHRIVHGGKYLTKSTIINNNVLKIIKDAIPFAPLHNAAHLIGIRESLIAFPKLINKNVAVFDTAFHQTIPEESYLYAIPYFLYKDHFIRRYGAHGINHFHVMIEAAKFLKKPVENVNLITCHLGNGSSVSAIRNGICIDTSMGLTPLEGLVMGTRSGDIDPAIIFYLHNVLKMSIETIDTLLNKKSGILALTEGITNDFRYVEKYYLYKEDAKRTMKIYCHRLSKYISSYSALMNGRLDAIVFTGGIGENAISMRKLTLRKLSLLNFYVDENRNYDIRFGKSGIITTNDSRPAIVISSDEELIIAKDTERLILENF